MIAVIARKWVEALRSGEYQKTTHALHTTGGYCCLGVLCELYRKEHGESRWVPHPGSETLEFDTAVGICVGQGMADTDKDLAILPRAVKQWAGMGSRDGSLPEGHGESIVWDRKGYGPTIKPAETLAELNDDGDRTFVQIADIIERVAEGL